MKESVKDAAIDLANLLTRFSFDLNGSTAEQLVSYWLSHYPVHWVEFALVEALYQGRYKAWSIEQILAFWRRRGHPLYHFNHEFERIVRGRFSRHLLMQPATRTKLPIASELPVQSATLVANQSLAAEPSLTEAIEPSELPELAGTEADLAEPEVTQMQDSSDRLHLLSSAESIAFLEWQNAEAAQAFTKDVPIQAFKPVVIFQSDTITKMKELALAAGRSPVEQIQQFTPAVESSDFYSKLKAVATERSENNAELKLEPM